MSPNWQSAAGSATAISRVIAHARAPRGHHHLKERDEQRQDQREMAQLDDQRWPPTLSCRRTPHPACAGMIEAEAPILKPVSAAHAACRA